MPKKGRCSSITCKLEIVSIHVTMGKDNTEFNVNLIITLKNCFLYLDRSVKPRRLFQIKFLLILL